MLENESILEEDSDALIAFSYYLLFIHLQMQDTKPLIWPSAPAIYVLMMLKLSKPSSMPS